MSEWEAAMFDAEGARKFVDTLDEKNMDKGYLPVYICMWMRPEVDVSTYLHPNRSQNHYRI